MSDLHNLNCYFFAIELIFDNFYNSSNFPIVECAKKKLLIGGLFPMEGGWAGGIGCKPATELALHDVNNNASILKDYELVLVSEDSKVYLT